MADRRAGPGAPAGFQPPLLDQATASELTRRTADQAVGTSVVPGPPRTASTRRRRSWWVGIGRLATRVGMLALGATITAGMVVGANSAALDADGVTSSDALRLGVMALLVIAFIGQLFAVTRSLPGARRLSARLAPRHLPPAWTSPPLLDQVSARQLTQAVPIGFGVQPGSKALASRVRRLLDLGSWLAMVALVLVLAVIAGVGVALTARGAIVDGRDIGSGLLQLAVLGLVLFAAVVVVRNGVRGLHDRRLRNRRRLLKRLLRYLLRPIDRLIGTSGRAADGVASATGPHARLGTATLATVGVLALAILPVVATGPATGVPGGPIAPGMSGARSTLPEATSDANPVMPSATESPLSSSPSASPTVSGLEPSPTGGTTAPSTIQPTTSFPPARAATPRPTAASPTPTQSVNPRPTATPARRTPEPVPTPTATVTPAPSPTRSPTR